MMTAPSTVTAGLPRLQWAANDGPLDKALGLDPARCTQVEAIVTRVLNDGGGLRNVLSTVQAEMTDLSFEEWTGTALLLGSLRLGTRCQDIDKLVNCPGRHGDSCHWHHGGCIGHPPAN